MKLRYCSTIESRADEFRQRLEALGHELVDAAGVTNGARGCEFFLLQLPPVLADAEAMIRTQRQLLAGGLPQMICGSWTDPEPVSRLLAAGADDYVPIDIETQHLGLRLHIFALQCTQRSSDSERLRLEAQLLKNQRLQTLASLAGRIAHDYNNLLSVIQGNAELALMDVSLDAPVRYSLEQVDSAAHRAAEISRQMLTFRGSNSDSKRIRTLNLGQLIRDIGELLRVSVSRNCRIEYRFDKAAPLMAGDPEVLRQLVMIVVENASAALGPGGGLIQIRTRRQEGEGAPGLVLEVHYSGSGPAVDGDSSSGLAAVQMIARECGTEAVWTMEGAGWTCGMAFPWAGGPEAPSMPGESGRSAGAVLLIDDDEAVRGAAHRILRRAGFTVFEASFGEEGLAVVAQVGSALDAVLLDLNMPGMECRLLLEKLRRMQPELRLVVWSGCSEEVARERLAGAPDIAFIGKTAKMGELAGALQLLLAE